MSDNQNSVLMKNQVFALAFVSIEQDRKEYFLSLLDNLRQAVENDGSVVFPIPISQTTKDVYNYEQKLLDDLGETTLDENVINNLIYTQLNDRVIGNNILQGININYDFAITDEIISNRENLYNGLPEFDKSYLEFLVETSYFYSTADDETNNSQHTDIPSVSFEKS